MKHIEKFIIEKLLLNKQSENYKEEYTFPGLKKFIDENKSRWGAPINKDDPYNFEDHKLYYFNPGGSFFPKMGYIYILSANNSEGHRYTTYFALLITEGVKDKDKIAINYCQYDSERTIKQIFINIGNEDENKEWPSKEFYINDMKFYDEYLKMINWLYRYPNINEWQAIDKFNKSCINNKLIEISDFNEKHK